MHSIIRMYWNVAATIKIWHLFQPTLLETNIIGTAHLKLESQICVDVASWMTNHLLHIYGTNLVSQLQPLFNTHKSISKVCAFIYLFFIVVRGNLNLRVAALNNYTCCSNNCLRGTLPNFEEIASDVLLRLRTGNKRISCEQDMQHILCFKSGFKN